MRSINHKKGFQILTGFVLVSHFAFGQVWSPLANFPDLGRDDGVGAVVNNKAYLGTGNRAGAGPGNDFYCFDPVANTWAGVSSMPNGTERQYAVAFSNSNYLFVHGGLSGANLFLNDTYRYDVAANTWSLMAPKPGNGILGACSFTINNKAYVINGRFGSDQQVSNEVWEYDMGNNTWTQKNNFPFAARWRSSATTYSNNGYMVFGKDANGAYHKEIYKYNAVADSWTKIGDFPQIKGRHYTAMQTAGNKMVLFGGYDSLGVFYKETWFFDESNGFIQGPDLPAIERRGGVSFAFGNKFYYTCGLTASNRPIETWVLDILAGVKENARDKIFTVYPNPFNDLLNISSGDKNLNCKIELCNLLGECVYEAQLNSSDVKTIHLHNLAKGIYLLKINTGGTVTEIKKVVKN